MIIVPFSGFLAGYLVYKYWCAVDDREVYEAQQEERNKTQARLDCETSARVYAQLDDLAENTRSLAQQLRGFQEQAETALMVAEREFTERAFAPFWDAIEKATHSLARYESSVTTIAYNLKAYNITSQLNAKLLTRQPPGIDLPPEAFPDVTYEVKRLRTVVRQAQKDFQFASIYEQRKTNSILVEGFTTLSQALSDLENRIESSVEVLADSLGVRLDQLVAANVASTMMIQNELAQSRRQSANDTAARREYEAKALKTLEEIRDRRKKSG